MPDWVTCPSPGSGAIMSSSPLPLRLVNSCLHNSLSQKYTHTQTRTRARGHKGVRAHVTVEENAADSCPRALRPKVFFSPVVVCIIALGFISNQRWTERGGWWTLDAPARLFTRVHSRSAHDSSARCNPPMPATGGSLRRSASLETSVIPSVPPLHPFVRKKTCHARANFEFRSVMNRRAEPRRYLRYLVRGWKKRGIKVRKRGIWKWMLSSSFVSGWRDGLDGGMGRWRLTQ